MTGQKKSRQMGGRMVKKHRGMVAHWPGDDYSPRPPQSLKSKFLSVAAAVVGCGLVWLDHSGEANSACVEEANRVIAENDRVSTEGLRVMAEDARDDAENVRSEFYNGFNAQLAETVQKQSIVKCGFIPNFIKKCLLGTANGANLGDSITVGGGTTVPTTYGFAYQAAAKLQTKFGSGVVMTNRGHGGYNASLLLSEIVPLEILPHNYDLIVVEAGTNDWNYSTTLLKFETDYRSLIETLITQTNADLICVGIGWFNGWDSPTHNPISETEYNKVIERICAEYKIGYIDVYTAMKNSGQAFNNITYAPDRVHPNDAGATIWANEVFTWFDYQGFMLESAMDRFSIQHQYAADAGITYTGTWGLSGPYASTFNKQLKDSSTAGSKATYDFVGSKLKLYIVKDSDRGKLKISLDGVVLYTALDCYSAVFDLSPLTIESTHGTHQLIIEVLGTKNALSSSVKCSLSLIDNYIYRIRVKNK